MKYKNYFKSIIYLALGAFTLGSCEDFLDGQSLKYQSAREGP